MKVVVIGDSISAGQYCDTNWPSLLTGVEVVNKGVSNDTTSMMLDRFPTDVKEQRPDVVIIQAGHNDCNRWATLHGLPRVSSHEFAANLRKMFVRCLSFGATPMVCTMTPTRKGEQYDADAQQYNSIVSAFADLHTVQVIDVRARFLQHPTWADSLLLADGIHLSIAGHHAYASVVQSHLTGLLEAAA